MSESLRDDGKLNAEDARILAYLSGDGEPHEQATSDPKPHRTRRGDKARKRRVTPERKFPVEIRNRYDGTHEGIRDRALREAIKRGVDPATVRATGPGSFEFEIR